MNGQLPNSASTKESSTGQHPTLKNVDFDSIWERRQRRQTHLLIIYLWVVLMICLAWFVGYWNFSFSWLLAIFIVTLSVWRTKVFRITEEHLMHEQTLVHRKRAMRGSETVEWLNFIVNRWCLFSSTGLCDLIKRRVDPILKKFKPALLEDVSIRSLTFGDQAPNIHHIQVFETSDGLPGGRKQASWLNVGKPPKELDKLDRYHIVFDMEAGLHCEQFKMVLATRVAGMAAGPDILVENLKVEGRLHASLTFSTDVPFPHVSKLVVSFDEKPSIWFSVKVLRSLQLMEIPLLKSWIHNLVLDVVCLSFVDPYKFEIDLADLGPSAGPIMKPLSPTATGVLSIFVSQDGHETDDTDQSYDADDVTFCTLQLGEAVTQTAETKLGKRWTHSCAFLVTDLQNQKLTVDVERKQMLSSISVATYDLLLASYSLETGSIVDAVLDREQTSLKTPLNVHMQYTEIPQVALTHSPPVPLEPTTKNTVCGVLYICVHGGYDLIAMDDNGMSDPYVVMFANRKKVMTSHYVRSTLNPRWEVRRELIVEDYTKTNLQFLVYDWDGMHANEDDFLGATHMTLSSDERYVVHKALNLSYNILNVGQVSEVNLGSIVVSVIFRPVPAIGLMNEDGLQTLGNTSIPQLTLQNDASDEQSGRRRKNFFKSYSLPEEKNDSTHKFCVRSTSVDTASKSTTHTDVFKLLSQGHGILELTIMCARNLVAMDSNGYSDPYTEVRIGSQKKFVTSVKKKTLNPVWDESVTTQLPEDGETLELSVWDKDPLMMKDFIGSVEFTAEDLKRISSIGEPGWYLLQKTKSGQIKLGIKVLTQDMKGCLEELSVFAKQPPPAQSKVSTGSRDEVFDNADSITAEVAGKTDRAAEVYGTLPKNRKKKTSSGSSTFSLLKRSVSDAQVNKPDKFRFFRSKTVEKDTPSHHTSNDELARHNSHESSSYVSKVRSALDLRSNGNARSSRREKAKSLNLDSTRISSNEESVQPYEPSPTGPGVEKFFNVKGTVSCCRIGPGAVDTVRGNLYCKLRMDSRTELQRKQKFSAGRVICKTPNVKLEPGEHPVDFDFEIDRGGGIPSDSLFIFDLKTTSKNSHLATRGYTLKNMFAETDTFEHWLPVDNPIQFLVRMSRDRTTSTLSRPSRNPLNRLSQSFSFKKPKSASSPVIEKRSRAAEPVESILKTRPHSMNDAFVERETFLDDSLSTTAQTDGTGSVNQESSQKYEDFMALASSYEPRDSLSSEPDPVRVNEYIDDLSRFQGTNLDQEMRSFNGDFEGHNGEVNGHYETNIDEGEATFIRKRRASISTDV